MTFRIEVQDAKTGNWRERTLISEFPRSGKPVTSPNHALKAYGIRGTRPRLGEATSNSGKRFRAVEVKPVAPKSRKKRR